MGKKVSVIVPVWNVENYIGECIDSILRQSYKNFEIVLVDDCSTDNSYNICKKYSEYNNNIKLFHKKWSGVSATRNLGLEKASGDYCLFVDSDDKLAPNAIELLVSLMEKDRSQFVISEISRKISHGKHEINIKKDKKAFLRLLSNSAYGTHRCLFDLKIIQQNNIKFDESLKCSEDALFNRIYFRFIDTISLTNEVVYICNKNNINSLSKKFYIDFSDYFIKKLDALTLLCPTIGLNDSQSNQYISERAIHGFKISMSHYWQFANSKNCVEIEKEKFLKERIKHCYDVFMPYIKNPQRTKLKFYRWYKKYLKKFDVDVFYKKYLKVFEFEKKIHHALNKLKKNR